MGTCLHWQSSVLPRRCPTGTGLAALQGSRQIASSVHLPQRPQGSPGFNTTDGAGRLWDRLIFNQRDTEVQQVTEKAECYKQPILAKSWRAL